MKIEMKIEIGIEFDELNIMDIITRSRDWVDDQQNLC
jgi:hypothetical protein